MKDPWNPTEEEIFKWAYDSRATHEQDWHLAVTTLKNAPLLLHLAKDPSCPKRKFFLSCLYLLVGDAFRTQGKAYDLKQLELFIENASTVEEQEIQKWIKRSKELLSSSLGYFDYRLWCLGGYVSQDFKLMRAKKRKK